MNFKKRLLTLSILLLTLFPSIVFAYSNKVILGGENIGIKVNTKNIMIVGFYEVDSKYIGEDAGLKVGDYITKINDISINTIDDMINTINNLKNNLTLKITFIRNNKENNTELKMIEDKNHILKTGLYVKDTINGIGTLTYIDPDTKIFGALGHEIAEKNSLRKVEIQNGTIYKSEIINITPSINGKPGSKNAKLYADTTYGPILLNTDTGIYGKTEEIFDNNLISVSNKNEIKLGAATLRTVINGYDIEEFSIDIIEIDKYSETKNLLFKITDNRLLNKTGGVVAGMSGSPIIQNNKIIGAVTHVVINEPDKGYGIFITTMLEEGDKIKE